MDALKPVLPITLLFLGIIVLTSCKKDKEEKDEGWSTKLKGTLWTGEVNYPASGYIEPQPFSLEIKNDGTVTWRDVTSTRSSGNWTASNDTIRIKFPNNTTMIAKVSETGWSVISAPADFIPRKIIRSIIPDRKTLTGSYWQSGGATLTFDPTGEINVSGMTSGYYTGPYQIDGAGIRFFHILTTNSHDDYFAVYTAERQMRLIRAQYYSGTVQFWTFTLLR